ncbi:MAG: ATP-binding protein [Nitrospiraceae bacterium]|nr:ATP-binding protein [Nitrospiraceae bacterium]
MKFYNRKNELAELTKLYDQANTSARLTVITGRRRVGKTMLALEFARKQKHLYLFVSKKSEHLLCMEYLEEIRKTFSIPVIGEIKTFKEIFMLLIEYARKERFTLIIDEFQEFYNINPSVYSDIQHLWDINKASCRLNLICIGSVYSLMHKIFEESKEPLFGRADRILFLRPFSVRDMYAVLKDHGHTDGRTLFDCFAITGGRPKYLDILASNDVFQLDGMLDFILKDNSPLLNEGRSLLVEEFGKEYGTYFSILELIASGKTARTEIESVLEIHAGAYLAKLETDYALIAKLKPINAKPNSRLQKYRIVDNFLGFWFRFIFKNRSAVETGNFSYIREIINRDYSTYAGRILESFYQQVFAESGRYNRIGTYWERGNQNEIDLVAVNDLRKEVVFADIKLDSSRINLKTLKEKTSKLEDEYKGYKKEWRGLHIENIREFLK